MRARAGEVNAGRRVCFDGPMDQVTAMLASMAIEAVAAASWGALRLRDRPTAQPGGVEAWARARTGIGTGAGALLPLALVAIGATALTHPLAWYAITHRGSVPYGWAVLAVEAGVVALEALAYWLCACLDARRALSVSLLANATSAAVGLLLSNLG
jgi:hypothetical protein